MIAMQCIPTQLDLEAEGNATTAACAEEALASFSDYCVPEGIEVMRIRCGHAAADADISRSFDALYGEWSPL
jgi:hypothetical protein